MPLLIYFPGAGLMNSEYLVNENKDILLIWLCANNSDNLDLKKRFTFKYYVVIKKAELIKEDPTKYANKKIGYQEFEDRAIQFNNMIKCINCYHHKITNCGWNVSNDQQSNESVLKHVKQHFSAFQLSDLEEGYKLSEFLKVLQRGITYERQYLECLINKYESVSDIIKK